MFTPKRELETEIESKIIKAIQQGFKHFICGGAWGFDMLAAESVLKLRDDGQAITLEIIIPCREQTHGWPNKTKVRYDEILEKADKITMNDVPYSAEAMHERNRQMVEKSKLVIAYYKEGAGGGTLNTIKHAQKANREIWYAVPEIKPFDPKQWDTKFRFIEFADYHHEHTEAALEMESLNCVYLTELKGIKELRKSHISERFGEVRILSWGELLREAKSNLQAKRWPKKTSGGYMSPEPDPTQTRKGVLSIHDQIHVIGQTIHERWKHDPEKAEFWYDLKRRIFELFDVLMMQGIKKLSKQQLALIKRRLPESTAELFELYNEFRINLLKVCDGYCVIPYQDALTRELMSSLRCRPKLIIEGFLYLTKEKYRMIKCIASCMDYEVVLVNKKNQFIDKNLYRPLIDEFGLTGNFYEGIHGMEWRGILNSITQVVANLHEGIHKQRKLESTMDKSIRLIEPFVSRDEEYRWIARDMINYVNENSGGNRYRITEIVANDMAIRINSSEERERFGAILKELGAPFKVALGHKKVIDYPIGKFIYSAYKMMADGIDTQIYKAILFANWQYYKRAKDSNRTDGFRLKYGQAERHRARFG